MTTQLARLCAIITCTVLAQAQQIDTGFAPAFRETCTRSFPQTTSALFALPDGSVLNVGPVYQLYGKPRAALRTLTDGTIDSAWGAEALSGWNAVAAAKHGDSAFVLLDRRASDYESRVIRVFADGTIDSAFASQPFGNGLTICLAVDAQQRVIVGGRFRDIRTDSSVALMRLTASGVIDTTFTPTSAGNLYVMGIVPLATGSMLVRGSFTKGLGGTNAAKLARVRGDGSVDETFKPAIDMAGIVTDMHLLRDGGIVLATVRDNDRSSGRLHVLEADGSARDNATPWNVANKVIDGFLSVDDSTFFVYGGRWIPYRNEPAVWYATVTLGDSTIVDRNDATENVGRIGSALRMSDGSTTVWGSFTFLGRTYRQRYARLTPAYALDQSYAVPCTISGTLATVTVRDDGSIVAGGYISAVGSTTTGPLVLMDSAGVLLPVQDRYPLPAYDLASVQMRVQGVDAQGRIYAVLQHGNNQTHHGTLLRLLPDGSLDSQYRVPVGLELAVDLVRSLPDGRAYVAGYFTAVGDVPQKYLARLLADGSLDTTFRVGAGIGTDTSKPVPGGAVSPIRAMVLGADGTLVLAGRIDSYDGAPVTSVVRLLADGRRDATFAPNLRLVGTTSNDVNHAAVLPDGGVVLAGLFSQVNDVVNSSVIRLSPTGVLDRDYAPDVARVQMMNDLLADEQGHVYVAGQGIQRIDANGLADDNLLVATAGNVTNMTLQHGNLVFVGSFLRAGPVATKCIGRVSLDAATSVHRQSAPSVPLSINPNPVDDVLWVDVAANHVGAQLCVVDITGRIVWQGVAASTVIAIPFTAIPSGTYAVRVRGQTCLVVRR